VVAAVSNSNSFFPQRVEFQKTLHTQDRKTQSVAKVIFDQFRQIWAYVGKLILLTKQVLKIILNSCKSCGGKIKPALVRMKIFSFATLPLNAESAVKEGVKVGRSAKLQDYEGAALSSLSIALLAGDAVDSAVTFTEGVLELASLPAVEWMGKVGLPLAFGLSTLGIFTRSYGIWRIQSFQRDFDADPLLKEPYKVENHALIEKTLRQKLEKHLGITAKEMKEIEEKSLKEKNPLEAQLRSMKALEARKENILGRVTSSKVASQMKELRQILNAKSLITPQVKSALDLASNIRTTSFRSTMIKAAGIAANVITLIGLSLFFFTAAPYVPFIFLAVAMVVRIGILIYEESYKEKGLLDVDFTPKAPVSVEMQKLA